MSDQTAPPAPAALPPKKTSFWTRVGQGVIGVAIVIVGGIKLINFFVLPTCDASNITDTVRDLFKSKQVELVTFDQIRTISDQPTQMCGAYIESADEKANIEYSVTWEGWSPYVKIEKVDTLTPAPAEKPADTAPTQ